MLITRFENVPLLLFFPKLVVVVVVVVVVVIVVVPVLIVVNIIPGSLNAALNWCIVSCGDVTNDAEQILLNEAVVV